jgi:hypothetical protein
MKKLLIIFALTSLIFAKDITLSDKEAMKIANKIWQNEGSGKKKYLVWWNKGEEFASLGIGHFIWYTKNKPMWFFHAFPDMLKYITKHGAKPPKWLTPNTPCIWNNYSEWKRAKEQNSPKMVELTNFLDKTKALQAKYMVHRFNLAIPKIINYAKNEKIKKKIKYNLNRLLFKKDGSIDAQGAYCLIDYTNFKGDGTLKSERYQGKGWGLFQVLKHMDSKNPNKYEAFANSARFILDRLIKISPPQRRLYRFKKGWFNRIKTYER